MTDLITKFGGEEGQEDKGLFTFYREQAEVQQQIKKIKRQLIKKQSPLKNRKSQQDIFQPSGSHQQQAYRSSTKLIKLNQNSTLGTDTTSLPRRYNKQRIGNSVIIVNPPERKQKAEEPVQQPKKTKKLEDLINPLNDNTHFLQSPDSTIVSAKEPVSLQQQPKRPAQAVACSYFNCHSGDRFSRQLLPNFSLDKLPQVPKSRPAVAELILPRRYKSRRIEAALRSNNSEMIKQIRESLREQSVMHRARGEVSYFEINGSGPSLDNLNPDSYRLSAKLDINQKRLIEILRNGSTTRKRYM